MASVGVAGAALPLTAPLPDVGVSGRSVLESDSEAEPLCFEALLASRCSICS